MSKVPQSEKSFLSQLLAKKAAVQVAMESRSDITVEAAVGEAERQILSALSSSNPLEGEGVTKSGDED